MASSTNNSSGVYSTIDVIGGGSTDWDNVIDISDVFQYSTATLTSSDDVTDYVVATNFGFDIPAFATIDGIVVSLQKAVSTNLGLIDYRAYLFRSGAQIDTTIGGSRHLGGGWTYPSDTYTYGSPTDKWNIDLTPTIVNDSTFGFGLSAGWGSAYGSVFTGEVQAGMEMTVYYTNSNGIKVGVSSAGRVYVGTSEIQRVYKGSTQIA